MESKHPENPVTISIVGTGDTHGGGMAPTPNKTIAETPAGQPNLFINVVPPLVAIAVRFGNAFLTTFFGLITAAGIGVSNSVIGSDFATILQAAAVTSLVVASVETIKNLITVFGRLEGKYPLLTGSI